MSNEEMPKYNQEQDTVKAMRTRNLQEMVREGRTEYSQGVEQHRDGYKKQSLYIN